MLKKFLSNFFNSFDSRKWNIGFIEINKYDLIKSSKFNIRILKHNYKSKWFADPFILQNSNKQIVLLVEEFDYSINKGVIAKLVIRKVDYKLISRSIVCSDDYHLSFPAIFKNNNKLFVHPENSKSGALYIYSLDKNLDSLTHKKRIINKDLLDPVILKLANKFFLFGTKSSCKLQNTVLIFKSNYFDKNYKFFDEIRLKDSSARSAGNFFKINNRIIRPAQDCNESYGKGIVFQEVKFDNDKFSIVELKRIYSNSSRYSLGMHTINFSEGLAVVDVLGYKNMFLGKSFNILKSIFK